MPYKGDSKAYKFTLYVNPARRKTIVELARVSGLSISHALHIAALEWLERHAHKDEFDAMEEADNDPTG